MFCGQAFFDTQFQKFEGNGAEVVDAAQIAALADFAVAAADGGEWGDEAACPPEIKVLSPDERGQGPAAGPNNAAAQRGGQPGLNREGFGRRSPQPGLGIGQRRGAVQRRWGQTANSPPAAGGPQEPFDILGHGANDNAPKTAAAATKPVETPKALFAAVLRPRRGAGQAVRLSRFPHVEKPQQRREGDDGRPQSKPSRSIWVWRPRRHARTRTASSWDGRPPRPIGPPACQAAKLSGRPAAVGRFRGTSPHAAQSHGDSPARSAFSVWDDKSGDSYTWCIEHDRLRGMVLDDLERRNGGR